MISRHRPRRPARPFNHRDLVVLIVIVFFAAGAARAQVGQQPDPGAGVLLLDGRTPAEGLRTEVSMSIIGMIAEVQVRQRFRNPTADWAEGVYLFPLPEDAAVNEMELEIDGRLIVGEIQEKEQARRTYQAARAEGRRAGLVTQKRPNLFATRVANIPPGDEVAVRIRYVQTLDYRSGRFSARFPMTLTPRYGEEGTGGRAGARVAATGQVFVDVDLIPGFDLVRLESPTHDVRIEEHAGGYAIHVGDEAPVLPDRDFELIWEPALSQTPQAALFTQQQGEDDYALLMMLPPQPEYRSVSPRELILVIDTSGSMQGGSLNQARESLLMALGSLRETDRFNLIEFNSRPHALFPQPVDATGSAVGRALSRVERLVADGGTEMAPALAMALAGDPPEGFVRQVVFITDGAVSGEEALFAAIERDLGQSRLFTVGIGAAPNSYFMRKAAQFGRGSFTYIGNVEEVAEKMDMLLGRLEHPVLTDVCVDWPADAETYPAQLPDLYLGEPLVVAARLNDVRDKAEVCGRLEGGTWTQSLSFKAARSGYAVATLWARRRIESLMDDLTLGADPERVRSEVVSTALAHRLVSRYTAFVAVDRTPVRSQAAQLRRMSVANRQPRGQGGADTGMLAVALPQTDAGTVMRTTVGVMLLLLGLILRRRFGDD